MEVPKNKRDRIDQGYHIGVRGYKRGQYNKITLLGLLPFLCLLFWPFSSSERLTWNNLARKRSSVEDDAVDFVDVRDNGDMDNTVDAVASVDALDVVDLHNVGRFIGVWKDSSSSFFIHHRL